MPVRLLTKLVIGHYLKNLLIDMTLTLTLTLNKIYFDINEKDKQQEIDNMISRYQ